MTNHCKIYEGKKHSRGKRSGFVLTIRENQTRVERKKNRIFIHISFDLWMFPTAEDLLTVDTETSLQFITRLQEIKMKYRKSEENIKII